MDKELYKQRCELARERMRARGIQFEEIGEKNRIAIEKENKRLEEDGFSGTGLEDTDGVRLANEVEIKAYIDGLKEEDFMTFQTVQDFFDYLDAYKLEKYSNGE